MANNDSNDDGQSQSGEQRDSDELGLGKIDPLAGEGSEAGDALLVARILGEPPPPPPLFAGRYALLKRLGRGGMGEVHAAYDDMLDRKVAIKFLRLQDGQDARGARDRFVREGKAMAQIRKHPNVVQVLDAGTEGERAYLSMEYIDGPNLSAWQEEKGRSAGEILAAYLQAGQGLAAIHAVGLVHRDFKPTNAFVTKDEDGRAHVAVGDFGLARATEPDAERPDGVNTESALHPAEPLTATGVRLGTIPYMAPEQLRGETADARSDQFAFCVSLYEALCGQRPFAQAGREPAALLAAIRAGMPAARQTSGKALPAHVERVLRRGLSMDPADRYPDMRSLLAELAPRPRRRWPWVIAGGAAALALVLLSTQREQEPAPSPCEDVAAGELTGIWDHSVQEQLHKRISRAGGTPLGRALATLESIMNEQAREWRSARAEVCERQRAGLDDTLLLERRECLRQNLRKLELVIRRWLVPNSESSRSGNGPYDDIVALHALRTCSAENVALLGARGGLAAAVDQAWHEQLASLGDRLARFARQQSIGYQLADIQALERQGTYGNAAQRAREALATAEALGNEPLLAEARFRLGHVLTYLEEHEEAAPLLESATTLAARHDMKAPAADFWLYRLKHAIVALSDTRLAHAWIEVTRYSLLMTGDFDRDGIRRAEYEEALGLLASREGKPEEAARHHREALRIREELFGAGGSDLHAILLSKSLNNLANIERKEHPVRAAAYYEEALALRAPVLAPDHPWIGVVLFNLGLLAAQQGNDELAMEYLERALAIEDALPGERTGALLHRLTAAGGAGMQAHDDALAAGRREEAAAHLDHAERHAITIAELHRRLRAEKSAIMQNPRRAYEHVLIARVHELRGKLPEALVEIEAALGLHAPEAHAATSCDDTQQGYRDDLVSAASLLCQLDRGDEARDRLAEVKALGTACPPAHEREIRARIQKEIPRRECRP